MYENVPPTKPLAGVELDRLTDCPDCGGGGEIAERGYSRSPFSGTMVPDPQCDVSHVCSTCGGEGVVR
jgi:hypothetical protein